MATFIIYCRNKDYLTQTLDDLIDKTPPGILEQIILCDESNTISEDDYTLNEWDIILPTNQSGRSNAWNAAAAVATSEQLVFLTSPAKFGPDWFLSISKELDDWTIVSPIVYQLDINLWATENQCWKRYGLRWDMSIYNRRFGNRSPLAAFCMVIHKQFFDDIGGFDDGAGPGSGESVCLSLKAWLAGGDVTVVDDSYVAMAPEVESGGRNLARLAESFFPKYTTLFYESCGVEPGSIDVGRIDGLVSFVEGADRSIDWWLENLQPELLGVYLLRNTAHGKRIAVVGDGPSLDYMNLSLINNHDIIISVDYIGLLVDSNYVMTNSVDAVAELRSKYIDRQFVVPYVMENRVAGEYTLASDVVPGAVQFEVGEVGNVVSVNPPFCDFGNCVHMALHFALFLGPRSISLFGCDNKIIEGKSHTSKLDYYNDGKIWTDSDQTKKRLSFYNNGIDQLGRLALSLGIPLIRVGHA